MASETLPFGVGAHGTGAFPNLDRPRVVWVGLTGEGLVRLAERVEAAVVRLGFAPEGRPYSPHLTIGRVRDMRGWKAVRRVIAEAAERDFGTMQIESMMLYRSILGREAAEYEELARYRLGRRNDGVNV
jgi:2'-5' RNA ligase